MTNKASYFSNMLVVLIFHHKPVDNPDINDSGPLFTKKTWSYQYRDSHYKPETVVRPS